MWCAMYGRLTSIFRPDANGRRPYHGADRRFETDPHWRDIVCFHEYFDGDTGRGVGASHQTGWTALVASCISRITSCEDNVYARNDNDKRT